jgi:hypothetical protein
MRKRDRSFDTLIQSLVGEVTRQLGHRVAEALPAGLPAAGQQGAKGKGRAAVAARASKAAKGGGKRPAAVDRRFGPRPLIRMICRVDGCLNPTPGAFHGYMCKHHRAALTPEQQGEARRAFKAKHKGEPLLPAPAPAPKRSARADDDRPWFEPPPTAPRSR